MYNLSDKILAVSEETKQELINDLGINEEKIQIFRNFVRKDMFFTNPDSKNKLKKELRDKYGYSQDDFIVIGSGQIQPRKGVQDFYEIAKKNKDMKFIWVGGMPFKNATEGYEKMNKILKNSPNNLKFTGTINREYMIDYYRLADVFFLPSIHETFGLVVIEAAGSGLPIILRNLEVYKKIFSPHYLAGNNNEDFGNILNNLKNDKNLYNSYKDESYELFSKYDDEMAFKKIEKIYNSSL